MNKLEYFYDFLTKKQPFQRIKCKKNGSILSCFFDPRCCYILYRTKIWPKIKGGFVQQQKNRYYLKANREKKSFFAMLFVGRNYSLYFMFEVIINAARC